MNPIIASALEYKRTNAALYWRRLLLLANLTPPILLWVTGHTAVWTWIYAIVVHGILLVGLFSPNSNWLGPVLRQLPTRKKIVWLTIDDGPSSDTIPLAEMLGEAGIHATFFLKGKELASHPECLESIRRHGHTIANHSDSHSLAWFWIFPAWKVAREVDGFAATLKPFTSHFAPVTPLLPAFRCPAGVKNPFLHSILHARNLTLVGWTVRAYDGIRCDQKSSLQRILQRLTPGAVLLVHEGKTDGSGRPASVDFIRELVIQVQKAGYAFA